MADITKTKSHNLDRDELRGRLEKLASEMQQKFSIKCRWDGDICHLSGAGLKGGKLEMTDSEVSIEITLGMMAKMLKGKIEQELESRMDKVIS
jgi:putative polyhydroxyalkanoate system protein